MKWRIPFKFRKWIDIDIGCRKSHKWFEFRIRGYGLDVYHTAGEGFGRYPFKSKSIYLSR